MNPNEIPNSPHAGSSFQASATRRRKLPGGAHLADGLSQQLPSHSQLRRKQQQQHTHQHSHPRPHKQQQHPHQRHGYGSAAGGDYSPGGFGMSTMETLERTRDPSPLRVPSRKLQPPSPIRSHPQSHSPGPAHSHGSMPHGSMPHGSMSHGGYEGMRLLGSADPRNGSFPEPARRSNEAPGQVRIASPVKTPSKWGGGSLSGGPASPVFTPPYPRESTASTSIDRRSRADSLGRMMLGSRATATAGGGRARICCTCGPTRPQQLAWESDGHCRR